MNTFVDFTMDELGHSADSFIDEYNLVHSDAMPDTADDLKARYKQIVFVCEALVYGFKELQDLYFGESFFTSRQAFWLLCHVPFTDFTSQFKSFIIEKNDPTLSREDYVLLFYISLQSAEIQKSIEGLPLDLVYDMFMPIAEKHLDDWKLHS
jgi:hypothetical protein